MRVLILIAAFILTACNANPHNQASEQTENFYRWYLSGPHKNLDSAEMQHYVAANTLKRLADISKIPEQEIVNSDYFTYTQDYDPQWRSALKVGEAQPVMGGEAVDVWLGVEDGNNIHLKAYLREEKNEWKIYRVRDITDNFEHKIFDAGAR
ncbi:YbjP/YqhG family protein [Dryocola clanedunensis]|uniref:YbjP/YqhG family protein n=1 Tax=Cedecea sulfonylureivorans TaxID=3051154 RepID=UPI001928A99F|nr:YbjP/YqhG family protein [Cedecea sulfonylureivorans]